MSTRQTSNDGYRYFAFISYSRKNEKWAKWLQRSLETYRLPASTRKEYPEIPKKIFPVFRDKTDLSGVVLENALKKELAASKYLIVICSPESAASEWVNEEIRIFIEEHGAEKVIPFIVDGKPYAADISKECFPQMLRDIKGELLGINVGELGKRNAFLRVVSTMLGLRFDEVVRRDRKRAIRRNVFLGALVAIFLVIAGYGVMFNTEQSRYYASYVTRFEIPEGRGELSASERKEAFQSFRIVKKRGRVIRVECVNSYGTVVSPSLCLDRYPALSFSYGEDGRVSEITQYDKHGNSVLKKTLSYHGDTVVIDLKSPSGLFSKSMQLDLSVTSSSLPADASKSEIIRQINNYDKNGRLAKEMYYRDTLGTFACDINGVYGKEYTYTDEGFVSSASMLNEKGEPYNCRTGWATEIYEYDKYGRITQGKYENADRNPARNAEGYACFDIQYEGFSPTSQRYYDENMQPCNNKDGASEYIYQFDGRGLLKSQKFYGPDGDAASVYGGVYEAREEYNEKGLQIKQSFFDAAGGAVNSSVYGYAAIEWLYDGKNRVIEERYFDSDGKPYCQKDSGAHIIKLGYDDNGYVSVEKHFDAQGNPIVTKWGYFGTEISRDSEGNILRVEYFGTDGKPCIGTGNYAVAEYEYDAYGNRKSVRFFDTGHNPCRNEYGVHGWDYKYEDGKLVSGSCVDIDGKPGVGKDFCHEIRYEYDEKGNVIREGTYDLDGKLAENVNTNYAIAEYEYNDYGDVTRIAYFSRMGTPAHEEGEYYLYEYEYDARGNVIWEKREANEKTEYPYVTVQSTYDAYGNVTSRLYRDREGNQMNVKYTQENFVYDKQGKLVRYDVTYASTGTTIVSEYEYDVYGNRVLEKFTAVYEDGETALLYLTRYTFDEYGQVILKQHTDEAGEPFYDEAIGYSSLRTEYSPEGYVIVEEFWGENGKPLDIFRYEYERDSRGNPIVTRRYGVDGKPLREADGVAACVVQEYDSFGYLVKKSLYNENGEPYEDASGSYAVYSNDSRGYRNSVVYYNKNGDEVGRNVVYAYVSEVYEDTPAKKAGVTPGIIVQYGNWHCFGENEGIFELEYELERLWASEKKLVMAYPVDGGWEFAEYSLGEGLSGIRIQSDYGDASKIEMLRAAYEEYLSE